MFHLYFGAFDVVLYLGGIYAAMALSKSLCDQVDETEATQSVTTTSPQVAPMQTIAPHLVAPAPKRDEVSVRVSAGGR